VFVSVLLATFIISPVVWSADQFVLFRNAASKAGKDNVSISPYGANLALALVVPGTRGETESELKSLLGYEGDVANLAGSLKITEYAKEGSPLKTATSLWIQDGFNVLSAFTDTAKANFAAEVEQVNFGAGSATADKINKWVDKNTNSKIQKLIEEVDPETRLIAISAIYFFADWKRQFDKKLTKEENFTLQNGEKKKVKMMRNQKVNFKYGKGMDSQWIEMPYKSGGFSAIVILPDNGVNPADVVKKLTADNFNDTLKKLKSQKLDVKLPQFKVEFTTSLKSALTDAGVKKMFASGADLTGISPSRKLQVSDVVQKVFIKVDEQGTEAAAATSIGIRTTSVQIERPPIEFYVDRPFIFVVKEGNNILFVSKVTKP
jgi:serpin B